jgi:hypothetical protein
MSPKRQADQDGPGCERYASHLWVVAPIVETSTGAFPAVTAPAPSDASRDPMPAVRLPEDGDPAPHMGRMVAMCVWAAVVTLLGMVVAIRMFIAIVIQPGPAWLLPTVVVFGIAGIGCAGVAFGTIHHKWLPWRLLGAATLLLAVNLLLVTTVL